MYLVELGLSLFLHMNAPDITVQENKLTIFVYVWNLFYYFERNILWRNNPLLGKDSLNTA
jgi:hypothetical protein